MKRSKFSDGQITFALRQAETGTRVAEVCRLVDSLDLAYRVGVRRACAVLECSRTTYYYRSVRTYDKALRQRIREIAQVRVRYGYQRIHVLLKREGWLVNHKRVYRIYCEEGLNLRRKRPKRRVSAAHRHRRPELEKIDQCWSMDFVADNLFNGRRIRALTVVDNFSRECLAIHVDHSVKADQVVSTMEGLRLFAGRRPQWVRLNNIQHPPALPSRIEQSPLISPIAFWPALDTRTCRLFSSSPEAGLFCFLCAPHLST